MVKLYQCSQAYGEGRVLVGRIGPSSGVGFASLCLRIKPFQWAFQRELKPVRVYVQVCVSAYVRMPTDDTAFQ